MMPGKVLLLDEVGELEVVGSKVGLVGLVGLVRLVVLVGLLIELGAEYLKTELTMNYQHFRKFEQSPRSRSQPFRYFEPSW
jgi:hypothetical protein